jgi:aminoglycoside/choline kinase family phosphotransferase
MSVSMIPPAAAPAFLVDAGWGGADIRPLAGDASFRRYFRVHKGNECAVLMDAPPPYEDPRPFITIAEYLSAIGLSAPRILHRDLEQGLLLIEDFGDVRMRETVDADIASETEIYTGVVDVLITLHQHRPLPTLTQQSVALFLEEVGLFTQWYCPAVGLSVDEAAYRSAWEAVLAPVMAALENSVTVLRDYHAENIMLIEGGAGTLRYGLLDFQDALAGHPAYDLVSMLEDARRDVTPAVERAMLAHYRAAMGAGSEFETAYWVLGAQRNTRILGVFSRLWKRDDKPRYRSFQPRMWGLLERNLAYPALAPLKHWFDANVPPEKRAPFWAEFL